MAVVSTNGANGPVTVHLITVADGAATDTTLIDRQDLRAWDAGQGIALLTIGNELATLDLKTGAVRRVGFSRDADVGPGVVLSPDGTQAAVTDRGPLSGGTAAPWVIDVVDLASGASRVVLKTAATDYNRAGLVPLRWLTGGIIVSPGVWDCERQDLFELDPSTGSLTHIADGEVGVLSSSGTNRAYSGYANLGDDPYEGQCGWHNQLYAGAIGAQPSVVRSQQNRDFYPLDVRDDGSVLYAADEASGATAPPAADMGLYLYSNGISIQQYGEAHAAYWSSAIFVGPDTAIATENLSFSQYGSVEVILVSLCRVSACQPSAKAIDNPTGPYPTVNFLPVRP